ncbi:aspartate racemase [Sphingorhabdus lutea]|uniref:Aspartate racemase n=1 Tax=Sphingorhabdus lutea TaxID=1913578 RepID=A0A1L3JBK3_9SPHN|nr:amino acid racemase [Sphingorhabdus lutea]APG62527.1 aspartate racemase [Sphingorhabdus lutea]
MHKIGLIGASNWYAASRYFTRINEQVHRRIGGVCSAPIIMESISCVDISHDANEAAWDDVEKMVIASAKRMQSAGAMAIFLCANSMHKIHAQVADAVDVPVPHIIDAVADKIKLDGRKSAALLGTRNVMTQSWYRQRFVKDGIDLLPTNADRVAEIDKIIHEQLMFGETSRDAERTLKTYITNIEKEEVDAVILGAAELTMIVDSKANVMPIYDSTEIHADLAVKWVVGD